MQAVHAVQVVRHRENRLLVSRDGLADALDGHGDAVVRRALLADDLVGGVAHVVGDAVHVALMVGMPAHLAEVRHRNARHVRQAPCRDLAVPVLADDARVHVARVDAEVFAERVLEARGVEHRAAAEHAVLRQARQLERHVRQDVHWVGHDQQDAPVVAFGDLRNDGLEDGDVLVDQVEPRFPRRLVRAGGDDGDGRVVDVGIVAGVDVHGRGERHAVRDVERLALGAVAVDVDEDHFAEQARLQKGEGAGGADEAASDDGDLAGVEGLGHGALPFKRNERLARRRACGRRRARGAGRRKAAETVSPTPPDILSA